MLFIVRNLGSVSELPSPCSKIHLLYSTHVLCICYWLAVTRMLSPSGAWNTAMISIKARDLHTVGHR